MKQFIFILALLFSGTIAAQAQCSIYVCTETGAWSVNYYDGNPPFRSMEESKQQAYKGCVESGGTNCQFFYSETCRNCWFAFIMGSNGYSFNCLAVWSGLSEEDAKENARRQYREKGGVNPDGAKVTTWYMPE